MGTSHTIEAVGYKGAMIAASLLVAIFFVGSAAFTWLVVKKTHKRWVSVVYAILLFVCLVIFGGIAYIGPKVRGKRKDMSFDV